MRHRAEARARPGAAAVARIVDAAQVDQHLEAQLRTIAQRPHHVDVAVGADDERDLAERDRRAPQRALVEGGGERRGQPVRCGGRAIPARLRLGRYAPRGGGIRAWRRLCNAHQRAIVFVRQILFWSCRMP